VQSPLLTCCTHVLICRVSGADAAAAAAHLLSLSLSMSPSRYGNAVVPPRSLSLSLSSLVECG
jgi:hypothetical protein